MPIVFKDGKLLFADTQLKFATNPCDCCGALSGCDAWKACLGGSVTNQFAGDLEVTLAGIAAGGALCNAACAAALNKKYIFPGPHTFHSGNASFAGGFFPCGLEASQNLPGLVCGGSFSLTVQIIRSDFTNEWFIRVGLTGIIGFNFPSVSWQLAGITSRGFLCGGSALSLPVNGTTIGFCNVASSTATVELVP